MFFCGKQVSSFFVHGSSKFGSSNHAQQIYTTGLRLQICQNTNIKHSAPRSVFTQDLAFFGKCIFPMTPHVCLSLVRSVRLSVIHPCSYRSTYLQLESATERQEERQREQTNADCPCFIVSSWLALDSNLHCLNLSIYLSIYSSIYFFLSLSLLRSLKLIARLMISVASAQKKNGEKTGLPRVFGCLTSLNIFSLTPLFKSIFLFYLWSVFQQFC